MRSNPGSLRLWLGADEPLEIWRRDKRAVAGPRRNIVGCEQLDRVDRSLTMNPTRRVRAASVLIFVAYASAQEKLDAGEVAVIEIGAAPSQNLKDHSSSFGPTVAVEVSPIEKWLELEAGVTPSFGRHTTEWGTDLLFKKPWTLSPTVELMAGLGPEWIHTRESDTAANSIAGEAALDLMFWPRRWKHRYGWYVEPAYEYNFGKGHERSIGASCGLLIAIPKR